MLASAVSVSSGVVELRGVFGDPFSTLGRLFGGLFGGMLGGLFGVGGRVGAGLLGGLFEGGGRVGAGVGAGGLLGGLFEGGGRVGAGVGAEVGITGVGAVVGTGVVAVTRRRRFVNPFPVTCTQAVRNSVSQAV